MSEQPQEIQSQLEPRTEGVQPDLQPQQPQPQPPNKRRKFFIIGGAVLLVIVLAGAAFLAGSLMNNKGNIPNNLASGGPMLSSQGGKGAGPVTSSKSLQIQMTPAPELPTIQADTRGVFLSRSGDSFTIGSGNVGLTVMGNGSGEVTPQASHDGPTFEVVITKDTLIYKDTTQFDPGNSGPTQQTVAPGTLDDLNTTTMVSVWGKKTSDRFVADVILYMEPMIKVNGGTGGALK